MRRAGNQSRQPAPNGHQHIFKVPSQLPAPQRYKRGDSARASDKPIHSTVASYASASLHHPQSRGRGGAALRPCSAPIPETAPLSEKNLKALHTSSMRTPRGKGSSSTMSACSSVGGASQWCMSRQDGKGPSFTTTAGMEMGVTKENQDSGFALQRKRGGDDVICGVIDGHGLNGHLVSEFIRENLASQILEQRRIGADRGMRAAIARGFVGTAKKLGHRRDIDAKESGAVAAICMKKGEDLYVANVGDTRAVLAYEDDSGRIKSKALTRDHTAALPSEQQRIKANGGEIAPIFVPNVGYAGPPRVWQRSQTAGGLMVTRAIGDTGLGSVGVTPEPEVVKHHVRPCDKLVVLASDGCWDHVSNDRAAEIAMQHTDPRRASEAIVREARHAWNRTAGVDGYVDDITCLVLKVH